ncbi:response regulator [uncultured Chitinophaga sp.]|jgi:Signal transduction histidine kinase|uniref:response regulator n=1 Tax=uncultured Chitinophaga sp. TaxID=339340 RepID=UPI00263954E7|nr:response regulator [uncultured Chitinophaga sp.]
MNKGFKKNLVISFAVSLLLVLASAITSYISIRNLLTSQQLVDHTNSVILKLENTISILKDAETGQRGFLISGKPEFLEPYTGALDKANRVIGNIESLTADNPAQQHSIIQLRNLISARFTLLQQHIDAKNAGTTPGAEELEDGRVQMDAIRQLIDKMQQREQALLASRTGTANKFAMYTSLLILIAALLSILVTVASFIRINGDFTKRIELQLALEQKDADISQRINIIEGVANKISSGDYKIRVDDAKTDALGSVAVSLNKMAISLDRSFSRLEESEWLQSGIAALNEKMIGEKSLDVLTYNILEFVTQYIQAQVGAFYILKNDERLSLCATLAIDKDRIQQEISMGEGIAGQSALSGKEILLEQVDNTLLTINYTAGSIQPAAIIAMPVFHEKRIKGVIELATLQSFTPREVEFLKAAAFNAGIAIQGAQNHQHLQELLAETQAQSEELQTQHTELENINTELEAQALKLQASEEELKVQQEELQQTNQELEERSRLLEERNELILERNLEIQAKAEALATSTRYKSEFLANMSHELRTPLNSILLLSRLMAENHEGNLTEEQIEYATVIQSSGNGLLTLIDEILDLSRIESGKMQLEFNLTGVEDIGQEMNTLFSPMAKDKGIAFNVETAMVAGKMIETDRQRLQQILRNLISNALKFTAKGSVTLRISQQADTIVFAVKDTGIGIPKDKQETIFEAFQQADGSTRRKYGGTGLGLSISRELAKLLGGTITLQSEEGKGSEFVLTLPMQQGVPAQPEYQAPAISSAAKHRPQEVLQTAETANYQAYLSPRIPMAIPDDRDQINAGDKVLLIIEDDTAFARSLLDYSRQQGYKGVVAVRGDEGITLAKQLLPTGILLDVQLPVKSGWEVMEELKSDPATRPIPIHMMSVHEVKTRSISRGAVDFINKPVALEKLGEVFSKIEDALSRHPKKVLIVEENQKHAQALSYFLDRFNIASSISTSINEGMDALNRAEIDCVILDMGIPARQSYDILENIKKTPGYENLPIIIFTGKNLSHSEEVRIKQYADSIVIKTAHSYQRILDEVSLFLHLVEEHKKEGSSSRYRKMGEPAEVLKGKTVLVADDDVRNIFSLTKSLEAYGMKVVSATDGKEALQQLEATPKIDLVLMDMMMPEMDGYESTKRIREIPAFRQLPIIAVTAKAMTGDREKCISAGASDYITKPVDIDQLISLLRVWLYDN